MKKRIFLLTALLLLALTVSAHAASLRLPSATPSLSFSGTTAKCSALCTADGTSDRVCATLTPYQGSTFVDSWSASGTYFVPVSGEHAAVSGKTYRLVLNWSINGVSQPSVSTTKPCP